MDDNDSIRSPLFLRNTNDGEEEITCSLLDKDPSFLLFLCEIVFIIVVRKLDNVVVLLDFVRCE